MAEIKVLNYNVVVIGGGPAGMAAAVAAYDAGERSIIVLERDDSLGGILRQCIHNGFGLHRFGEELTGPEYAARYEKELKSRKIAFKLNTMVTSISAEKLITAQNAEDGIFRIKAGAVVLAMGCRERPKGALGIAGRRPAGIYTAGAAQKYVNMKGYMPGREVVILGSGDIGLIMARRMTLEGACVKAVLELMPYSGGLARNIEQCLNDFDIPLMLSHTVTEVHGDERVTGVTVAAVDENRRPIEASKQYIECDTLLLSCGLIPENELTLGMGISLDRVTGGAAVSSSRETEIPGVFAAGNVLHVHDLVDYVSEEAELAGAAAAAFVRGELRHDANIRINASGAVRYTVPQRITCIEDTKLYFRVSEVLRDKKIVVRAKDRVLLEKKKQKLAPGEMETVDLKRELLLGLDSDITISVE